MRWWRLFKGKQSSSGDGSEAGRRRRAERYEYEVKLGAKCSSWPHFEQLMSGDVSHGGIFIPTTQAADIGEQVQLDLTLPTGATMALSGVVVNITTEKDAAKHGRPAGLGIKLDELAGEMKRTFDKLIEIARAAQPQPDDKLTGGHPIPPPSSSPDVRPTGKMRITAVQEAIAELEAEEDAEDSYIPQPTPQPPPSIAPVAPSASSGLIVGIDLGTTNTSVACAIGDKIKILSRKSESKSIPSVVSVDRDGSIVVGEEARRRITTDPAHTFVSPKRLLGRTFDDREAQNWMSRAPFRVKRGADNGIVVQLWNDDYTISQLCGYLLAHAKLIAEQVTSESVARAVVSVPASFDELQIEALHRAGELAGLQIVAIIDEPSAAALANRFDSGFGGIVGVYDFGGGTFDFSLVDVSRGDFLVLGTAGDTWLGGDDFDTVLAEAAANQFWREHKVDLRKQPVEWQRLVFACEQAKRDLSAAESAIISVPDILRTATGMLDMHLSITRPILERACQPLLARSFAVCDRALKLVQLEHGDLSCVYLSGGTTYVPVVRDSLANHFGVPVRTGVPPEHAVCLGAAIHAAQMQYSARRTLKAR